MSQFIRPSDTVRTRLPSNLRPTTRKCVHLVTRGHFRSRDQYGGHTIRSAIVENPVLDTIVMAVCFMEPELLPIEVLHCGNRNFRLCVAQVALTLTRSPLYMNLFLILSRSTR